MREQPTCEVDVRLTWARGFLWVESVAWRRQVESGEVHSCRYIVWIDEQSLLERGDGMLTVRAGIVVQCKLFQVSSGHQETTEKRTWIQTFGLFSSLTSPSWIAPLAWSTLLRRRNVAADISHRSLRSLLSR